LSPVEAIRGSFASDRKLSRGWMAGAGTLLVGLVLARSHTRAVVEASSPLILLGAVLLTPLVTRPVARLAGRLTRRLAPGLGDIGVMHLVKERTRSAYTLALVMIVLALVLAIGGVHRSYRATQELSLARALPADLAVTGSQRVDAAYVQAVASTPGVRAVTELRFGDAEVLGHHALHVFLTVIDPSTFFAVQPVPWSQGSDASARRALEEGDAVLVPQGLARLVGVGIGGRLTMDTTAGAHRFRVAGIYPSNDSQQRVTVGVADARRYFNAGDANVLAVRVRPGASVDAVGRAIQHRMAAHGGAFVRPTSVDKARFRKSLNDYFRLAYAVLVLVLAMGLLGLGNTLAMSVVRRTREIGVLRSVGAHRSQVRLLMLVESATLTLVALVLAVPLGWLLSVVLLRSSENVLNVVIPYKQPWPLVPVIAVLALLAAGIASVAPARRASRVEPVTALRFE
jgi:putative ABC transport system permease protein